MTRSKTAYETFEAASTQHRRLLQQEKLILEVTDVLSDALRREGLSKTDLATRLEKTKGFVSQVLAGDRNLTLRTIADVADALGYEIHIQAMKKIVHQRAAFEPGLVASEPQTILFRAQRGARFKVNQRLVQPSPPVPIDEKEFVAA